jgi:hypothetical protein
MAEMDNTESSSHKELRPSNIVQSEEHKAKVVEAISNFINPFKVECHNLLYCLSSGSPAATYVEEDLLQADSIGKEAHNTFIQERLVDNTKSFHSPITRRKLKTFANRAKKSKVMANR